MQGQSTEQLAAAAAASAIVGEAAASAVADALLEGMSEEEKAAKLAAAKEEKMRKVLRCGSGSSCSMASLAFVSSTGERFRVSSGSELLRTAWGLCSHLYPPRNATYKCPCKLSVCRTPLSLYSLPTMRVCNLLGTHAWKGPRCVRRQRLEPSILNPLLLQCSALTVLASSSGVSAERQAFMELVRNEIERFNTQLNSKGSLAMVFRHGGVAVSELPLATHTQPPFGFLYLDTNQ